MLRTELLLPDAKCSLKQWLRLGVLTLFAVDVSEPAKARCDVGMLWTPVLLGDFECLPRNRKRPLVLARSKQVNYVVIEFRPGSVRLLRESGGNH